MKAIYFLAFLMISCSAQNNKKPEETHKPTVVIAQNYKMNHLEREFGKNLIYKALVHLNSDFRSLSKDFDYLKFDEQIDSILSKDPTCISISINSFGERKKRVMEKLQVWCEAYIITSMPVYMDEIISLEEIIYNIPQTNFLIKSFLTIKEQDWGSLSTSQVYELPYLVCNYITNLKEEERIIFYNNYFTTMKKLIINKM